MTSISAVLLLFASPFCAPALAAGVHLPPRDLGNVRDWRLPPEHVCKLCRDQCDRDIADLERVLTCYCGEPTWWWGMKAFNGGGWRAYQLREMLREAQRTWDVWNVAWEIQWPGERPPERLEYWQDEMESLIGAEALALGRLPLPLSLRRAGE